MKWSWVAMPVLALALVTPPVSGGCRADELSMETVEVTAPRVKIADVIAAIARRLEREDGRQVTYSYTSLTTVVIRKKSGDYSIEETASRFSHDQEQGDREVQLWQRLRRYEGGEQVEDEVNDRVTTDYAGAQKSIIAAMPFSPGGASHYKYRILAREVVGNSLIYKVGFAPRSRFEALPAGTIWVDYSNWVVRKIEASMTGAVPYPMFLKSVPVYRMSQERFGEFWFPSAMYMRLELREIPLLPMPASVEVRLKLQDVVINGEPQLAVEAASVKGGQGTDPADDAGDFWLTKEASDDSLAAYWTGIDKAWSGDVTPQTGPVSLPSAQLDSLSDVGADRLTSWDGGSGWSVRWRSKQKPGYNRVQGLVPMVGLTVQQRSSDRPRLNLRAGYGLGNKWPVMSGTLDLPLVRSRWRLAPAMGTGERLAADTGEELAAGRRDVGGALGAQYQRWALRINGRQGSALFAGDGRRDLRSLTAFLYGGDPNHYYREKRLSVGLRWRLTRGLVLRVGGGWGEYRSEVTHGGWNVWGREPAPQENLAVDEFAERFVRAGASWRHGPLSLSGTWARHDVGAAVFGQAGAGADGGAITELRLEGQATSLDTWGNRWVLRLAHHGIDANGPRQWKSWLGDYGTLRGYNAGELTGDASVSAALDVRLGVDLWQALRVPVLRYWGLQPIGFVDWGRTWDVGGAAVPPLTDSATGEGARGWRADVGFGFGKRFDVPGLGAFHNVRVYAARPVGEASSGRGWRVLLAFEKGS